jgi:uncharacterized protein (UPF0276 family)
MAAVSPTASSLKTGIGLRARHHAEIVTSRPDVGWLEIHAENYMGGGAPLHYLDQVRAQYPVAVHGVGLSLAAAQGIDPCHLGRLAQLVARFEPMLVSEHLAWTGLPGQHLYLSDLLPLPYTEEALAAVAANVDRVQTALRRPILIENPSLYLAYADSPIPEPDFLAALSERTGCGILCDVNNIHVSCTNVGGDPYAYLEKLPAGAVGEMHLAGHCAKAIDGVALLIDDHGSRVAPAVWALYERALALFPNAPTLIEWDTDVPELTTLVDEAAEADRCRNLARRERHACFV